VNRRIKDYYDWRLTAIDEEAIINSFRTMEELGYSN